MYYCVSEEWIGPIWIYLGFTPENAILLELLIAVGIGIVCGILLSNSYYKRKAGAP